ncbi:MAG: enoyl-CoA hydratase [Bacteroidota bacterium]
MSDHILTHADGGVLRLTINRPEKKNALTVAMYAALAEAFQRAEGDPSVRVVLLHGAGDAFTAGNDLMDFAANPPADGSSPVFQFLTAISTATKPVVAAVHGPAIGIGTTLLLHCDLVYATPDARLQMPFTTLGLCPEAASSYLLPLVVGPQRAAELLLLGDPFTGEQAHAWGLVNELLTEGDLLNRATAQSEAIAARPPASIRLTKQFLRRRDADAVQATIRDEAEAFLERLQSPEAAEAFTAFFEKRTPDFSSFN